MPSLFRFLVAVGLIGGHRLCRGVLARKFREVSSARNRGDGPVRPVPQEAAVSAGANAMARRPTVSDEALVELFLDMLAAERGAGKNTLAAYRNDLADLATHLKAAGKTIGGRRYRRLARLHRCTGRARLQGLLAGAAAVGGAPALSFPLRRRKTLRRSGRRAGGAQARPQSCRKCCRSPKSTRCWRRRARRWRTSKRRRHGACVRRGC